MVCELHLYKLVQERQESGYFGGRKTVEMGNRTHRGASGVANKILLLDLGGGYKYVLIIIICPVQFSNLCFIFQ